MFKGNGSVFVTQGSPLRFNCIVVVAPLGCLRLSGWIVSWGSTQAPMLDFQTQKRCSLTGSHPFRIHNSSRKGPVSSLVPCSALTAMFNHKTLAPFYSGGAASSSQWTAPSPVRECLARVAVDGVPPCVEVVPARNRVMLFGILRHILPPTTPCMSWGDEVVGTAIATTTATDLLQ